MSKRNLVWLAAIVVVGLVVGIAVSALWGVVAAVAVLLVSEVVERARRRKRRAERGAAAPSPRDAIAARRKR